MRSQTKASVRREPDGCWTRVETLTVWTHAGTSSQTARVVNRPPGTTIQLTLVARLTKIWNGEVSRRY